MFSTPKWDIDDIGANNSELFGTNFLRKAKKSKKERERLVKIDAHKSTNTNLLNNIKVHSKAVPSANAQNNNLSSKEGNVSVKRSENNNADLKSLLHKNKKRKKKSRKLVEIGTSKPTIENRNVHSQKKKHRLKSTVPITNALKINFPVKEMGISLKKPDEMNATLYSTSKKRLKIIPKNETVASVQKAEPFSVSKRKRKLSPSINTNSLQWKIKKKKLNESHMNDQLLSQSGTEEKSDEDIKKKSSKQGKKRLKRLKKKTVEEHNMSMQANDEVDLHVPHQKSRIRTLPFSIHKLKNIIATSRNVKHSERENIVTKKQDKKQLSLRERMMRRLKASRFRYINEQLYTSDGKDAKTYFQSDPEAFIAYHEGYKQQINQWPINPLDVIIKSLKKKSSELVVADFGCGDARLAHSIPNKVHSFDLVAASEEVTACNMAHTPLSNASVDIVVFCLSLMGNNLSGYFSEANRVLKEGGLLMIAEVESRFESVEVFIQSLQKFGFVNTWKDLSYNLFYFMNFKKEKCISKKMKSKLPELTLKPCLYKKR